MTKTGRRKSERSTRDKLNSPGKPPIWKRENLCRFWRNAQRLMILKNPMSITPNLPDKTVRAVCSHGLILSDNLGEYVPLSFDPGEAFQFDWRHEVVLIDGVTTTVKVANVRLSHSRMPFVRAYPRETQEMVFDAHGKAFAFFGGACARGIYDNMKTAVDTIFVGKDWAYNCQSASKGDPLSASKTCLVSFDNNRYSVDALRNRSPG